MTSTASDHCAPTEGKLTPREQLFVAFHAADPSQPPSRHAIEGLDEVRFERGPERRTIRAEEFGRRSVTILLSDRFVSSSHARLVRAEGRWALEDLGSKNGTLLNGAPANGRRLEDGDRLQIGHTLLLFRDALPTPLNAPADLESTGRVSALATLLPSLAREFDVLARAAASSAPALLLSETGTGKELLAREVHALSGRPGDFVPVNCGGLPPALVESMLFGHRRGAFSGAVADQVGLFRAAHRGTLFLDEVGDMPLPAQAAMLRALQEGEILAVGDTTPARVDLRVIAATHRDIEACVAEGRFREDLLARLAGFSFRLPPLRERREDVGLLTGILLRALTPTDRPVAALSPEVATALLCYDWPRNIRELQKCLERATALAGDGRVEMHHLPEALRSSGQSPRNVATPDLHQQLVKLLTQSAGNVTFTAQALRTSRAQVHRWMKRYGLTAGAFRR